MIGRMHITDLTKVQLELRNVADRVTLAARAEIQAAGERIVKLAKDMTPILTGDLTKTVRIEKTYKYGGSGRLQVDITAGGLTKSGIDTSGYVELIHEHYESILKNGKSKANRRKEKRTGQIVGSKFLDRAAAPEEKGLSERIIAAIIKIKGVTL